MDEHFAPSLLSLAFRQSQCSLDEERGKTVGEISLLSHVVNAQQSFSVHSQQTRRQSELTINSLILVFLIAHKHIERALEKEKR